MMGERTAREPEGRIGPERAHVQAGGARLNSWKEVARYFERDERTVKRWETTRGLPIHRLPGEGRSKIYALVIELDAWLLRVPKDVAQHGSIEAPTPPPPTDPPRVGAASPRWTRPAILALTLLVAAITAAALALSSHLPADRSESAGLGSHDADAIALFQAGQHAWATRTAVGLSQARDHFTGAIVADPHFARAYSGLAKTLLLEREYGSKPDEEAFPQALAAAERAEQINPNLAEAHSELGLIDFYWLWRPAEADRQFQAALRLDQREVTARIWYAGMLRLQQRYGESLFQISQAQSLAPESTQVLIAKAMLLVEVGQFEAGDRLLTEIELAEPEQMWAHWVRARDSLLADHLPEYIKEMKEAVALRPSYAATQIINAAQRGLGHGGREPMLRAELQTELSLYGSGQIGPYEVAGTYALLGNFDQTTSWLRRAVGAHQLLVLGALSDPVLAEYRVHRPTDFLAAIIVGKASSQTQTRAPHSASKSKTESRPK